jgi:hypothetical protein
MTRIFRPSAAMAAALMLLAVSAPLGAHHGTNISYDRSKQFTTQAVVKSFEYRNPHPELHVEFKDERVRFRTGDWNSCPIPLRSSGTAGAAPRLLRR